MPIQWRIQDFPQGGAPTPKNAIIFQFFAKNCMKMKEFGPQGGGARPWRPPWIRQCNCLIVGKHHVCLLSLETGGLQWISVTKIFLVITCQMTHKLDTGREWLIWSST